MQFAMHPDRAVCNMHPAATRQAAAPQPYIQSHRGHSSLHTPENKT